MLVKEVVKSLNEDVHYKLLSKDIDVEEDANTLNSRVMQLDIIGGELIIECDVLFSDEDDDFKENDAGCDDWEDKAPENYTLNGVEYLWDVFDDIARKHNYHLTIVDESVRDEERANFGKAMSVMGTIATNENGDLFTPFIRVNLFLSEGQGSVLVIDRNGNYVLSGRELKRYNFTDYTNADEFVKKVNSFFEEYKNYNSENRVKE